MYLERLRLNPNQQPVYRLRPEYEKWLEKVRKQEKKPRPVFNPKGK